MEHTRSHFLQVNHHLLDIFQRPLWRVVKGRSNEYVKRVCSGGCLLEHKRGGLPDCNGALIFSKEQAQRML